MPTVLIRINLCELDVVPTAGSRRTADPCFLSDGAEPLPPLPQPLPGRSAVEMCGNNNNAAVRRFVSISGIGLEALTARSSDVRRPKVGSPSTGHPPPSLSLSRYPSIRDPSVRAAHCGSITRIRRYRVAGAAIDRLSQTVRFVISPVRPSVIVRPSVRPSSFIRPSVRPPSSDCPFVRSSLPFCRWFIPT